MSLTIDEMYQAAASGETSWEHALLLTGLLYYDGLGLEVSPPPLNKCEYQFYKRRIDALCKYSNDNRTYKNAIKILQEYVYEKSYCSDNQ